MKFLKFEFPDGVWAELKQQLQTTIETTEGSETSWNSELVIAVVEIGHICKQWGTDEDGNPICEVESPLYAVDILWQNEPIASFEQYVVFPKPCGVHIFAGWEAQYALDYCAANPEAEYCQPPVPPVTE